MHRRKLHEGLRVYRGANLEELQLVDRFDTFIDGNVDCFDRSNLEGHVTGSAWLVSPDTRQALLTHHKKLGRWLQLGGHSDGEPDTLLVSKREAEIEFTLISLEAKSYARYLVTDSKAAFETPIEK